MERISMNNKELLDIKTIVEFGIRKPEDFEINFLKEIYDIEKTVRIRGLSSYEYDQIELERFDVIKDKKTKNYTMGIPNKDEGETKESLNELEKIPIADREIPDYVRTGELLQSYKYKDVLIVYYAMKDFYDNITINDVKKLEGLSDIAKRVNEKSGQDSETLKKIKFFRSKSNEHGPTNAIS